MPFEFAPHPAIPDVVRILPRTFGDARGFFRETFKASEFAKAGLPSEFVQDNQSASSRGVLRGMHYQLRSHAQGMLVRCSVGHVFDVVVDIRRDSPTYGRHAVNELREEDALTLWVPEGFAHGFYTLSDRAELVYKMTREYSRPHERVIQWNDPALGIHWPLVGAPTLSEQDAKAPPFAKADNDFVWEGGR